MPDHLHERVVLEMLASPDWSDEERAYINYHVRRFSFLLQLVGDAIGALPRTGRLPEILDVGPHFVTHLLQDWLGDRVRVSTMGWANTRLYDAARIVSHYELDLNEIQSAERLDTPREYDVVIMAEVIEHLYIAPEEVLAFFLEFVRPGGILILQTPNAVALRSRLLMLLGRNPFDRIRTTRDNPGHYREYTRTELADIGSAAGFIVESSFMIDYFRTRHLQKAAGTLLPGLRRGITMILRRPSP